MSDAELIAQLDAALPQTQCRQCGYAGCRPYAEAMAARRAGTNQCPPGGIEAARALASILGVPYAPVDIRFGISKPPAVAVIDEALCIGCTLCIKACPVDAIVGATRLMHTVVAAQCTGCELCLPPCPVDCITMVPAAAAGGDERRAAAGRAKRRFEARERRLERARAAAEQAAALKAAATRKQKAIQCAVARARARIARRKTAD
jgi:electron transport complex protein RnfB